MGLLDNLVSWWDFSSDLIDAHAANDLTGVNSPTYAAGKVGNALDLEVDDSQYAYATSNSELQTGDVDFTIALWIKPESLPSGGWVAGFPVAKWNGGSGAEHQIVLLSDGTLYFNIAIDGIGASNNDVGSTVISAGNWYCVIVWHDATANEIGIQINNATEETEATTGAPQATSGTFYAGCADGNPSSYGWDGLIESLAFCKGRCWDASERASYYNSGDGLSYEDLLPKKRSSSRRSRFAPVEPTPEYSW